MALLYSSGTTGKPKGAATSHNAGIANLNMTTHPRYYYPAVSKGTFRKLTMMTHPRYYYPAVSKGTFRRLTMITHPRYYYLAVSKGTFRKLTITHPRYYYPTVSKSPLWFMGSEFSQRLPFYVS